VFVSAHGNVFMREIAEHLVEALVIGGRSAQLVTDTLPCADRGVTNLVVAPHEFFGLFPATEDDRVAAAGASTSINTEQPGTSFFELAVGYARHGGVVLDINPFALDALRRSGVPAVHLPLGMVPSMDRWHRRNEATRTIDLSFMGGRTPRREAFIGGAASVLWEWRTDLRFFSWHRPVTDAKPFFAVGDAKYDALAQTRILLNVHRGEEPYFEWARVVEAIANGCVVATESSAGIEPLVAGEHILIAPLSSLAEEAVALAFDEPRRARMAGAAYDLLRSERDQATLIGVALAAVAACTDSRAPTVPDRRRALPATRRAGRPRRPTSSAAIAEAASNDRIVLEHAARRLKRAYLAELATSRGIERSLARLRFGEPDAAIVTATGAVAATHPDVSVVIPLHDQGQYLREAVGSVVACATGRSPAVEIVVVDDHSTDDSLEVAHALVDEMAWFPITVVARAANGGLPAARNTGFAAARGRYVLALDADNLVYPSAIRVLTAHLNAAPDDVIAAYGLLERFDEGGAVGLTSHLPWDVDLLVQGAYIDAMALVRRSAWAELGGYAEEPAIHGWEDYDLWLAAAARGWRADLVGTVVGRYREQPGSMRKISDIDMNASFVTLRERHPRLPWPS
jgi:GT2 family glycosyltransferase